VHECQQKGAFVTVRDPHISTPGPTRPCGSDGPRHGRPNGTPISKGTPARGNSTSKIGRGVSRGRAATVKRSFDLKSKGHGPAAIARALGNCLGMTWSACEGQAAKADPTNPRIMISKGDIIVLTLHSMGLVANGWGTFSQHHWANSVGWRGSRNLRATHLPLRTFR
jgi:hypothetical protein